MKDDFKTLERNNQAINPSKDGPHYPKLEKISEPHIQSYNSLFAFGDGVGLLDLAILNLEKMVVFDGSKDVALEERNKLEMWFSNPSVGKPIISGGKGKLQQFLYPVECRERGISYKAPMQIKLNWRVNNGPVNSESLKCNLEGKSPAELIERKEDPEEFGGFFVTNGIERLIRLLIVPRRNHPTAIIRPSFQNRGPTYTKFGISIRCVRNDQSSQTLSLHYCTDGFVSLRFSFRKNEYMVPILLVLKALCPTTDKELFERITMGEYGNTFLTDRVEMLLRSFRNYSLFTQEQCLEYIGSKFAVMLDSPEDSTEAQVGRDFLRRIIMVHLDNNKAKFDLIIFMLQKLYGLVSGDYGEDNPDSLQFQETLLGGHLYLGIIKEKMQDILAAIKTQIVIDLRRQNSIVDFKDRKYLAKVFSKCGNAMDIGRKMEYFLSTGNLVSNTGLDLQQTTGYTIIAEKLNFYRYVAHYRSIHRGSFFAELKTTTVRKLLPESWGFLCPVHTPDGSPCGLLNHLSHTCEIVNTKIDVSHIPALVASLGAAQVVGTVPFISDTPIDIDVTDISKNSDLILKKREQSIISIQLDGKVIGWCKVSIALKIAQTLRDWKVKGLNNVPLELEIGYVPPSSGGQYPGLFLFSTPARMIRAVRYLPTGTKDFVGPFEQVYMNIACMPEDVVPGMTTHQEFNPTDMLSVVASLTPFSDFNQSPRNMYQCQMGKQAMGTPAQNFPNRTDNKMYRLQTGQTPVVRPNAHNEYGLDGYPNGMNAVVCVISYTGYDMEDASILSKSSFERGYGYGTIYKGEWVDLSDHRKRGEPITHHFGFVATGEDETTMNEKQYAKAREFLDEDGLPMVGIRIKEGDPYYAYVDDVTGKVTVKNYKGEDCIIDQVRIVASDGCDELQKVHIKIRIPRPPIIGDKFSSRHGQKGVISQKWPSVDMPFSESGIIPDVIINPHAFPSRMTIGMFVESLAGKAGALHGHAQDATPFKFNEDHAAAEFFGEELKEAGFNYHGNEPMYSGITGEEFKADIYIGVVYYQRLRHMVSDKYQVRTTGPVHNLTQQPIKGRKRAGGIRLGEMERDSLLAHGVSFILQDRLMNCSDYSQCHVCTACGSILSPMQIPLKSRTLLPSRGERIICKTCNSHDHIDIVAVPYVFRYLCAELVAMNVKLIVEVQ
ncbi:hypothetical protein HDV06_002366 [Boothiomyces sp. JEL0866]|nr:hypothetical protein HDV06_002366 [Boothiomyces sp. JEL0866]